MEILHKTYLPFTEEQFKEHFVQVGNDTLNIDRHIERYKTSIGNYPNINASQNHISHKKKYQIEKDEIFWTASSLMTIFHSQDCVNELSSLLKRTYGDNPPLKNFSTWNDCLKGKLHLFFEAEIPSPRAYKEWLKSNVNRRNFIPYMLSDAKINENDYRDDLEGPTHVDAMILNSDNGFAVFIEAKVLSDISYMVTYDSMRNQIARNIDVLLDENENLSEPLCKRNPENTLFLLLTPQCFRDNPKTRLYGYKYYEYKNNPEQIGKDLEHRKYSKDKFEDISRRLGWITWEDLKNINSNCCKWMSK